jgi:hypothetical protein
MRRATLLEGMGAAGGGCADARQSAAGLARPPLGAAGVQAAATLGPPGDRAPAVAGGAAVRRPGGVCRRPARLRQDHPAGPGERARRPRVAGVSLDRRDNDPVVLVPYLAAALDRVEPVDPGLFPVLASPGGSVVPQLVSSVVAMTEPVTVVLDQLESLENRCAWTRWPSWPWGCPPARSCCWARGAPRPCRWPCCGPRAWGGGRGGRAGHGPDREPGPAGGDRGRPVRCA